jgi:hypothetical protein
MLANFLVGKIIKTDENYINTPGVALLGLLLCSCALRKWL